MPGYRHQSDVPGQAEVLAALHAEIAARSPEHAALVDRYETVMALRSRAASRVPPGARGGEAQRLAKQERVSAYSRHRDAGLGRVQAAAAAGISPRTAEKYETIYRRGRAR